MPCSCCARDEPPPVPIAPMRVILRWKRDEKVRSIDGEIVFVDADLEIPMGVACGVSDGVVRSYLYPPASSLGPSPSSPSCASWVRCGRLVSADRGGRRGWSRGKFEKSAEGGETGRTSGGYRARTGWKPGIGLGGMSLSSSLAGYALDRQTWISEGQARCALAPATDSFFERPQTGSRPRLESPAAFAVASSAGLPWSLVTNARATGVRRTSPHIHTRGTNTGASTRRVRGETRRARCRQGRREPRATEG